MPWIATACFANRIPLITGDAYYSYYSSYSYYSYYSDSNTYSYYYYYSSSYSYLLLFYSSHSLTTLLLNCSPSPPVLILLRFPQRPGHPQTSPLQSPQAPSTQMPIETTKRIRGQEARKTFARAEAAWAGAEKRRGTPSVPAKAAPTGPSNIRHRFL